MSIQKFLFELKKAESLIVLYRVKYVIIRKKKTVHRTYVRRERLWQWDGKVSKKLDLCRKEMKHTAGKALATVHNSFTDGYIYIYVYRILYSSLSSSVQNIIINGYMLIRVLLGRKDCFQRPSVLNNLHPVPSLYDLPSHTLCFLLFTFCLLKVYVLYTMLQNNWFLNLPPSNMVENICRCFFNFKSNPFFSGSGTWFSLIIDWDTITSNQIDDNCRFLSSGTN